MNSPAVIAPTYNNPNVTYEEAQDWLDLDTSWSLLPEAMAPWLSLFPRLQDYVSMQYTESDQMLGGNGYVQEYYEGCSRVLGHPIVLMHDLSEFRWLELEPRRAAVVDPVPSMLCRAMMIRHSRWEDSKRAFRFVPGTHLYGIELGDDMGMRWDPYYRGFGREDNNAPDIALPEFEVGRRFYEDHGLTWGDDWLREIGVPRPPRRFAEYFDTRLPDHRER